jgi:hypothetical protein
MTLLNSILGLCAIVREYEKALTTNHTLAKIARDFHNK